MNDTNNVATQASDDQQSGAGLKKTSIARGWKIKFGIFALVGFVLFAWGLYDGVYLYPKRGESHARFMMMRYLEALDTVGGLSAREASVPDPAETLAELSETPRENLQAVEEARYVWLTSLSRVRSLDDLAYDDLSTQPPPSDASVNYLTTAIRNPGETLRELDTMLGTAEPPNELAFYDIPSQYVIAGAGLAVFLLVVWRFIVAKGTTFTFDPVSHHLRGPGVDTTPGAVAELDKSRWHKYFVTLIYKDGGKSGELDLYRFHPLEAWVLEIEKLTDSYEITLPSDGSPIEIMVIDALSGVAMPIELIEDYDGAPFADEDGRPVRFPVFQDSAGVWHVYDHRARAALRASAAGGDLAGQQLHVDPQTGIARPTEVREPVAEDAEPEQEAGEEADEPRA